MGYSGEKQYVVEGSNLNSGEKVGYYAAGTGGAAAAVGTGAAGGSGSLQYSADRNTHMKSL